MLTVVWCVLAFWVGVIWGIKDQVGEMLILPAFLTVLLVLGLAAKGLGAF
jgi:hypothetical protein